MKRRPEGVESMWAMVRWRNGRLRFRRGLSPGLLALCCRIGLHFMVEDSIGDRYACRCRRDTLPHERIRLDTRLLPPPPPLADDIYAKIRQAMEHVAAAREENRHTIFCRPEDEARIRSTVAQTGDPDVFKVVVSPIVASGQAYVVDERAIEAELRNCFAKIRPY